MRRELYVEISSARGTGREQLSINKRCFQMGEGGVTSIVQRRTTHLVKYRHPLASVMRLFVRLQEHVVDDDIGSESDNSDAEAGEHAAEHGPI